MKSESLHRLTFLSCVSAVAVVGYLWLVFENIEAQRQAADVKYIASLVELDDDISTASLSSFVGKAYELVDRDECRSDLVYAGSSVILLNLDRISAAESNLGRLDESLRLADRYFSHALSCAPTSGDAWARLAMVRSASGVSAMDLAPLLERSRQFAPADGTTLAARLSVWTVAPEQTLRLAEGALDWDLAVAFSSFSTKDLAQAFSQSSVPLRKKLAAIASSLPPDRVKRLRDAGLGFLPEPTLPSAPALH